MTAMNRLLMTFLLTASACALAQDQTSGGALPGQVPPNDKAETVSGKSVEFPAVLHGTVAACIFGFGKDSVDRVSVWLENLSGDNVNAWSVVNLETIPSSVARNALRVSMRIGTPKDLMDRSLVISKDSKEWKRVLEVQRETIPVVAVFDKTGAIVWKRQGTFSASIADELKAKMAEVEGK